jgi:hypothetical protein
MRLGLLGGRWARRAPRATLLVVAISVAVVALGAPAFAAAAQKHAPAPAVTFAVATSFDVGTQGAASTERPAVIAVADLDSDGELDVASANGATGTLSVLLGTAKATFGKPRILTADGVVASLAIADTNGDGRLDIVAAVSATGHVAAFLGTGGGKFAAPVLSDVRTPAWVAAGRFDADDNVDLAIGEGAPGGNDPSRGAVMRGRGDGRFTLLTEFGVSNTYGSGGPATVADADGDGLDDIFVINPNCGYNAGSTTLLLSDGKGGFASGALPQEEPDHCPQAVAVLDVNEDGRPDIATANSEFALGGTKPGLRVHLATAKRRTWASAVIVFAPVAPVGLKVADVDGDGHDDLVGADAGNGTVSVYRGNGRTLAAPIATATIGSALSVEVADVNHDGRPDLITGSSSVPSIQLVVNTTPLPGPCKEPPRGLSKPGFSASVHSPSRLCFALGHLVINAVIAGSLGAIVAFPSQLFDSTLEQHYGELRAWWERRLRRPWRRVRGWVTERLRRDPPAPHWVATSWGLGIAAALYVALDPGTASPHEAVALFLGMVVALSASTWLFTLPRRLWARTQHAITARAEPFFAALPIAVACVVLSRVAHFQPGYLYGAIAGLVFVRALPDDEEGPIASLTVGWTLAMALAAWLWRSNIHAEAAGSGASMRTLIADNALSAMVVAGIEGAVVRMLPIRVFDGSAIKRWNVRAWIALFLVTIFMFVTVLLNPDAEYVGHTNRDAVVWSYALFVAFGALSVGFWLVMRRRDQRGASNEG